ncbi:RIP homotypic interaction motif-containing protein [Micromonospora chersina]|uniref:RIP homotypic interaction motif-containing protein n=1 Tax=Micromonospora chersina TaxID=47854 RepID=A0A1C6UH75_9ACTN|nr:RIP homotypic interaction motif-containing protein [Micromonospora chersina]SCL53445.1 RIP homotypic interaction motif-containing protein [Micromonospora chersina]
MSVVELTGVVVPYLTAVAGAYGGAVMQRVVDQSADATADAGLGVGRRLFQRLLGSSRSAQIGQAVTEVGEQPDDAASRELLRAVVVKALSEDAQLAKDVAQILADAGVSGWSVTVLGSQGVQVGSHNTQTNNFGPDPDGRR